MRTEVTTVQNFEKILYLLTEQNRLIMQVALNTGLRISDVLSITRKDLNDFLQGKKILITEQKTGKNRILDINKDLANKMLLQAGSKFIFEHRLDQNKHKTRQAIFKDVKRAKKSLRIKQNIAPHSARKMYAVHLMEKLNDINKVRDIMQHTDTETTMLYAFADIMSKKGIDSRIFF